MFSNLALFGAWLCAGQRILKDEGELKAGGHPRQAFAGKYRRAQNSDKCNLTVD